MRFEASFVTSAAGAADFPRTGLPEIALVGRSNVGKSTLINALVRQQIARTSAAPGKTRLANFYRVARGAAAPLVLVDLPGYGFAKGGSAGFADLARAYFGEDRQTGPSAGVRQAEAAIIGVLLLVDARHPGLENDLAAWNWLRTAPPEAAVVATKIDKLARGQRIRAMRQLESVFQDPVLPVSAVTGEGLEELWKLIDTLVNSRSSSNPPSSRRRSRPRRETAPHPAPRK